MIVSERGIEYGFSPLTHPDDFTNPDIKRRTREIARSVLEQLPAPGSPEAKDLERPSYQIRQLAFSAEAAPRSESIGISISR